MNRVTRRVFLRRASLGVAAVGVATTVPSFLRGAAKPVSTPAMTLGKVTQQGPLVAHIPDAASGEITLMIGSREISYRNAALAQQLLGAAQ